MVRRVILDAIATMRNDLRRTRRDVRRLTLLLVVAVILALALSVTALLTGRQLP